jgi:hypothetical protein
MVFEFWMESIRGFGWFAKRARKSLYDEVDVSVIIGTYV